MKGEVGTSCLVWEEKLCRPAILQDGTETPRHPLPREPVCDLPFQGCPPQEPPALTELLDGPVCAPGQLQRHVHPALLVFHPSVCLERDT